MKIEVRLPSDRTKTGTLKLIDDTTGLTLFGPVSVLGRAARSDATAHGNPTGDPLKPYGDTPLGTYSVMSILTNGGNPSRPTAQYGQSGSIRLDPTGGDAAKAKANGRTGLLIHAGHATLSHRLSNLKLSRRLMAASACAIGI